jgi:hypothetical protein
MQYQDYTIFNQLHVERQTLFVKVINNVMLTVYEATLMKNNCKYKLETITPFYISNADFIIKLKYKY